MSQKFFMKCQCHPVRHWMDWTCPYPTAPSPNRRNANTPATCGYCGVAGHVADDCDVDNNPTPAGVGLDMAREVGKGHPAQPGPGTSQEGASPAIEGVVSGLTNPAKCPHPYCGQQHAPPVIVPPYAPALVLDVDTEGMGVLREFLGCRAEVAARPPYDPEPPVKAKAIDGWVFCDACGGPRPATGHEHEPPEWLAPKNPWPHERSCADFLAFAAYPKLCESCGWKLEAHPEFAESLLCAMAWDHAANIATGTTCEQLVSWASDGECAFCDAARAPVECIPAPRATVVP